jgi:TRAP-type mannitol/chloroaromatic compound transport system substrate-binding protein
MDLSPDLSYILATWFDDSGEFTVLSNETGYNNMYDIMDEDMDDAMEESMEDKTSENNPHQEDRIAHFPDFETQAEFHCALRYFAKWILDVPEEQYQQWYRHNGRECDFLEIYCRFESAENDAMAAMDIGGERCCSYHRYLEDIIH